MICRKCGKKLSGGFGPKERTRLDKALREALDSGKGRRGKLGIMQIGCLDICPKNAVMVALGSRPGTLYAVRKGTPIDDVIALLGLRGEDEEKKTPPTPRTGAGDPSGRAGDDPLDPVQADDPPPLA